MICYLILWLWYWYKTDQTKTYKTLTCTCHRTPPPQILSYGSEIQCPAPPGIFDPLHHAAPVMVMSGDLSGDRPTRMGCFMEIWITRTAGEMAIDGYNPMIWLAWCDIWVSEGSVNLAIPEQKMIDHQHWGQSIFKQTHMGVSINGGTPKWMVYHGKNH